MKQIVFDCDNTFGVPDCDVDDGLALLYLLGCPDAKVHGITATYGNSRIGVVMGAVRRMLHELGRTDIVLKKGGARCGDYDSEASAYLAEMADRYPQELSVLATGSLTNLMGAYRKDKEFFEKVKEIVLMGGITEPLVFEKKVMDELNFSCDAKAAETVLAKGKRVSVITGNNCLKVLFTKEEYRKRLFTSDRMIARYIREKTDYWFDYNEEGYGIHGFYNWDVLAAVYLMHPEFFRDDFRRLHISEQDLRSGFLRAAGEESDIPTAEGSAENAGQQSRGTDCVCNLPAVGGEQALKDEIYGAWLRVNL